MFTLQHSSSVQKATRPTMGLSAVGMIPELLAIQLFAESSVPVVPS